MRVLTHKSLCRFICALVELDEHIASGQQIGCGGDGQTV